MPSNQQQLFAATPKRGVSKLSNQQLGMIHRDKKRAGLDDAAYRMILRTAGGADSAADLDQEGFEKVMAMIENVGNANGHELGTYWHDRQQRNRGGANPRQVWKIRDLYSKYLKAADAAGEHVDDVYQLEGLVSNATRSRTRNVEEVTAHEAWKLTEELKGIVKRFTAPSGRRRKKAMGHEPCVMGDPLPIAHCPSPDSTLAPPPVPDDDIPF